MERVVGVCIRRYVAYSVDVVDRAVMPSTELSPRWALLPSDSDHGGIAASHASAVVERQPPSWFDNSRQCEVATKCVLQAPIGNVLKPENASADARGAVDQPPILGTTPVGLRFFAQLPFDVTRVRPNCSVERVSRDQCGNDSTDSAKPRRSGVCPRRDQVHIGTLLISRGGDGRSELLRGRRIAGEVTAAADESGARVRVRAPRPQSGAMDW